MESRKGAEGRIHAQLASKAVCVMAWMRARLGDEESEMSYSFRRVVLPGGRRSQLAGQRLMAVDRHAIAATNCGKDGGPPRRDGESWGQKVSKGLSKEMSEVIFAMAGNPRMVETRLGLPGLGGRDGAFDCLGRISPLVAGGQARYDAAHVGDGE